MHPGRPQCADLAYTDQQSLAELCPSLLADYRWEYSRDCSSLLSNLPSLGTWQPSCITGNLHLTNSLHILDASYFSLPSHTQPHTGLSCNRDASINIKDLILLLLLRRSDRGLSR